MLDYSRSKQALPFLDRQKLIAWEPLWPIYNPQLSRGESEFLLNCLARHFDPLAKAVKMQSLWIVDLTSLNDLMAKCLRCRPKYFHLLPIWDVSSKGVSNLKVDGVTESSVRRVCITTTWAINVLSFKQSMTMDNIAPIQTEASATYYPLNNVDVQVNLHQFSTIGRTIPFCCFSSNSVQEKNWKWNFRNLFKLLPDCCLTDGTLLPPANKNNNLHFSFRGNHYCRHLKSCVPRSLPGCAKSSHKL